MKKNKMFITAIFVNLVLLGVTIAGFYLVPQQAKDLKEISSQLMAHKISQQNYEKTKIDLENVKSDYQTIQNSLPNAESIVDFIEIIDQVGETTNLKMFTFNSDLPIPDGQKNLYLPLTLVFEDSLPKIIKILNLFENSKYFFQSTRFQSSSTNIEESTIKATFDFIIYVDSNFEQKSSK